MQRIIAIVIVAVVVTVVAIPLLSAGDAKTPPKQVTLKLNKHEQGVITLTNKVRAENKLPPLRSSERLVRIARAYATLMAKKEEVAHFLDGQSPFQRLRKAGYKYYYAGENVGSEYGAKPLIKQWMKSKAHRANIVHQHYTEIGVGAVKGKDGLTYFTQLFGKPRPR